MIPLEWRGVAVDRLGGALRGLRLGVAPLWAAGYLPAFLKAPENRAAISAYEDLLFGAVDQWSRAHAAGRRTLTLRLSIPAATARAVVSLARDICRLMVDAQVMLSIGLPPASPKAARFALDLIDEAERAFKARGPTRKEES